MQWLIYHDAAPTPGVAHGIRKLTAALEGLGHTVERRVRTSGELKEGELVVGAAQGGNLARRVAERYGVAVPQEPESLVIAQLGEGAPGPWLLTGSDDRGAMYAALEAALRVGWTEDPAVPFRYLRPTTERPYVPERALSIYTMHRRTFEERFLNGEYWARYLDLLAENRFSTFALLLAYESSGYFAPPYPYFFEVEGFPEVRVVGWTPADQARYSAALRRLIDAVHARGLRFTLGIWDHIYRGGVQRGPDEPEGTVPVGRVEGVTAENLIEYNVAGLTKLVRLFPEIDGIQFRMHGESGLTREEMDDFWDAIYDVMRQHAPHMRFDARVKGFPDSLIERALEKGVPIRLCTKYWMEQMGLPFHPTHIHPQNQKDRRHGYADLLRHPKRYSIHWRLWNGGTNRVLLWGSPEYVRRFAESTHLYEGEGYEVNEPLATKMAGQPHDEPPFALHQPSVRFYEWEFERYWHFFQVFGRVGYNPNSSSEVWEREFRRRFGEAGEPLMRALHTASWILPTIVAYNYPYHLFPTTRGWIEKQRMGDLEQYASALPSDTELFMSFSEAAAVAVGALESGKQHPLRTREQFRGWAREVRRLLETAERRIGALRGGEYRTTRADLEILAGLAEYHAERIPAGLGWALYQRTGDLNALDEAVVGEERAVQAWSRIVRAAEGVYAENLKMGIARAGLTGHWRDELLALKRDWERLQALAAQAEPPEPEEAPFLAHVPVRQALPGQRIVLRATARARGALRSLRVILRPSEGDGSALLLDLEPIGNYRYATTLPEFAVRPGLQYALVAEDESGRTARWPQEGFFAVAVTDDREPPKVVHAPPERVSRREPVRLSVEALDPSGVRWVRVHHRPMTQFEDYRVVPMTRVEGTDRWEVLIEPEPSWEQYDWMYFLEAMDGAENGAHYPSPEERSPYWVVPVDRGSS